MQRAEDAWREEGGPRPVMLWMRCEAEQIVGQRLPDEIRTWNRLQEGLDRTRPDVDARHATAVDRKVRMEATCFVKM